MHEQDLKTGRFAVPNYENMDTKEVIQIDKAQF